MADQMSDFAKAIEARERPLTVVESCNFLGDGEKTVGAIAVRAPTKAEENVARVQAEHYLKELGARGAGQSEDPEMWIDAKTAFILHTCIRDAKNPQAFSAFPNAKWMMQHFTNDELHIMLNHLNAAVASASPFEIKIDDETVEAYAARLAGFSDTDVPALMLANTDREWLIEFAVHMAIKLKAERDAKTSADRADAIVEAITQDADEAEAP